MKDQKVVSNYEGVYASLADLSERIDTGRKSTSPDERRKNIDSVKGLISIHFVPSKKTTVIYGNHATSDIEAIIRRSEIELSDYELKQGILTLFPTRSEDQSVFSKVIKTLCAIANNGSGRSGKLIIGVTDKEEDAKKIEQLDGIPLRKVGKRFVVGVAREAKFLALSAEEYFSRWKHAIRNSEMSEQLKNSVLSNMDYNDFYGLGVIVITVPSQNQLSYLGEEVYWREGDATVQATSPKLIASLAMRFT